MTKGISLHVGLNTYDTTHYPGLAPLLGAERDAKAMALIAHRQGFATTTLLASAATLGAVRAAIAASAAGLTAGDTFLFTFAGHGSVVPDQNGDEPTGTDQTLCLHDRQILDDQLYADFAAFAPGVRIVMVSDSCHSGSVARELFYEELRAVRHSKGLPADGAPRTLPLELAASIYLAHQPSYDEQQTAATREAADSVRASVLLLAACQDLQEARDGAVHGKFTAAMLGVWNGGKYLQSNPASYRDFLAKVSAALADPSQIPNLFEAGAPDPTFAGRQPFVL
jgi:hypothetical protein